MPVILGDEGSTHAWLNSSAPVKFETLLKPYDGSDLAWYPVTPAVGKLSFDGPESIKELKSTETSISKFFSNKGSDKVKGPKKLVKSLDDDDSAQRNVQEDVKYELKTEAEGEVTYNSIEMDAKADFCSGSSPAADADAKCHTKRDYDEFLAAADAKPSGDEIEKPLTSPAKKKGNIKGASDKQPTLWSYFAKS